MLSLLSFAFVTALVISIDSKWRFQIGDGEIPKFKMG
jgi:hypothetical protein